MAFTKQSTSQYSTKDAHDQDELHRLNEREESGEVEYQERSFRDPACGNIRRAKRRAAFVIGQGVADAQYS